MADRPTQLARRDRRITALLMALDRLENRPCPVELVGWI
jgi:hypothetical protein